MPGHKLSIICCLFLLVSTLAPAKIVFKSKRDGNNEIYMMNDDGNQIHRLTNSPLHDKEPIWSPDGRTIAFTRDLHLPGRGKGQQLDVFIMNADGSNQRNLTQHPALEGSASWSPDGRRLAFTSNRSGSLEIHVMDVSGDKVEQLTDSAKRDGYASNPSWSPDGKHIAYELSLKGKGRDIYIVNADGKNAKPLAKRREPLIRGNNTILRYSPRWSPDGKYILYHEEEYAPGLRAVSSQLVIRRRDGSNPQVLAIPKTWRINSACWAASGTQILFSSMENGLVKPGGNYEIYRYNRTSRQITNLTNHPSTDYAPDWSGHSLSVSPVGKLSIQWGEIKEGKQHYNTLANFCFFDFATD